MPTTTVPTFDMMQADIPSLATTHIATTTSSSTKRIVEQVPQVTHQSGKMDDNIISCLEASCLFGLLTNKRPVSRRNRSCWYLRQVNKRIDFQKSQCSDIAYEQDVTLVSVSSNNQLINISQNQFGHHQLSQQQADAKMLQSKTIKTKLQSSQPPNDNEVGNTNNKHDKMDANIDKIEGDEILQSKSQNKSAKSPIADNTNSITYYVSPKTKVLFLSKSISTTIILDTSPSVVSVSSQCNNVFLDLLFDSLQNVLNLLVKTNLLPSSPTTNWPNYEYKPKIYITVIAYTPFPMAKTNQILVQNRQITSANLDKLIDELSTRLNRLVQELCEISRGLHSTSDNDGGEKTDPSFQSYCNLDIALHPETVLDEIYELGLFASSLMPKISRLSLVIISDCLITSTNNLNIFRLRSISVSFISLSDRTVDPSLAFGYAPYLDFMEFVARTTRGTCLTYRELLEKVQALALTNEVCFLSNPIFPLFVWSIHEGFIQELTLAQSRSLRMSQFKESNSQFEVTPKHKDSSCSTESHTSRSSILSSNHISKYRDWRVFKKLEELDKVVDVEFDQLLFCFLRDGFLIRSVQLKYSDIPKVSAELVLHWRHNLDLEVEISAPCWTSTIFSIDFASTKPKTISNDDTLNSYETYTEIMFNGSYSFLHNLYCSDRRAKRGSEYRNLACTQFKNMVKGLYQTFERLQYLSRFYRELSLSKVPTFLVLGNSLLYEQPHDNRLTSTLENTPGEVRTNEFQDYWQSLSCLDTRSWKNLMHIHTIRFILEHDQPKQKHIHSPNANGRYTHVQCRRASSILSNFIKNYASFALLEDTTYIKFLHDGDGDPKTRKQLAAKGFVVIRINNKLLPVVVISMMFTCGIEDSDRMSMVSYMKQELTNCKMKNVKTTQSIGLDSVLRAKLLTSSSDTCCSVINSPLEKMLKTYSKNFVSDFLMNNWSYGLPGHSSKLELVKQKQQVTPKEKLSNSMQQTNKNLDYHNLLQDPINPKNIHIIFNKYLYCVRLVETISNLPHDLVSLLTSNVLIKLSSVIMNLRIKQGFKVAYNNWGISNLILELNMSDTTLEGHNSTCLCQYVMFPPYVSSSSSIHTVGNGNQNTPSVISEPSRKESCTQNSLGSHSSKLTEYLNFNKRGNNGEIKVIKEYWIEQQFGTSIQSPHYHESLAGMQYPELANYLVKSDTDIFNCMLTYELLHMFCDKLLQHQELDKSLMIDNNPNLSSFSNIYKNYSNRYNQSDAFDFDEYSRRYAVKAPLVEINYRFSIVDFLNFCQQASIALVLFKDKSKYFVGPNVSRTASSLIDSSINVINDSLLSDAACSRSNKNIPKGRISRKMSENFTDLDTGSLASSSKVQTHRSSFQHEQLEALFNLNPLYSQSLNHLFLDTLQKRLRPMHDRELRLSSYDLAELPYYIQDRLCVDRYHLDQRRKSVDFGLLNASQQPCKVEMDWKCYLKRSNQEDLLITLIPATLEDVYSWNNFTNDVASATNSSFTLKDTRDLKVNGSNGSKNPSTSKKLDYRSICPILVYRCSSVIINNQIISFLEQRNDRMSQCDASVPKADIKLHFGLPCQYMGETSTTNDELKSNTNPLPKKFVSDETTNKDDSEKQKTQEPINPLDINHYKAFLRKIKNSVLKSRFSSLNDAYLSELFVHKDDILYYLNNIDSDTLRKCHVSAQLKNLNNFLNNYEEYLDSLPNEPKRNCNQLLNSILLQKCGLFMNQPIARLLDEANPLVKQLHDKKLLNVMKSNYRVEIPLLEENLAKSTILSGTIKRPSQPIATAVCPSNDVIQTRSVSPRNNYTSMIQASRRSNINYGNGPGLGINGNQTSSYLQQDDTENITNSSELRVGSFSSSLGKSETFARLMDSKCVKSLSSSNSPKTSLHIAQSTLPTSSTHNISRKHNTNYRYILEAFRGQRRFLMANLDSKYLASRVTDDSSLRHEAHMAEVMRQPGKRRESSHYRRVLKSTRGYGHPHGVIDQSLRRLDSLGRLEHFCLTPLLFSPNWRSSVAPVRNHALQLEYQRSPLPSFGNTNTIDNNLSSNKQLVDFEAVKTGTFDNQDTNDDELWHAAVCSNYIKEYEQYIQTLGFNSIQIRTPISNPSNNNGNTNSTSITSPNTHQSIAVTGSIKDSSKSLVFGKGDDVMCEKSVTTTVYDVSKRHYQVDKQQQQDLVALRKNSVSMQAQSRGSILSNQQANNINNNSSNNASQITNSTSIVSDTGYLIKFLTSGCLVFKVGFCKPYVYNVLYSIEGERFNSSSMRSNMTAFIDELNNIKLTMHLHSFTYDYHLRTVHSNISSKQTVFYNGYHLTSFIDDFLKYYQKAPNYARNHILSGEVIVRNLKIPGKEVSWYIIKNHSTYGMGLLEMSRWQEQKQAPCLDNISASMKEVNNQSDNLTNNVLVDLKGEKIVYKNGKDTDIFDCGLLITYESSPQTPGDVDENCVCLKYYYLLTNQRDLYPRLMHQSADSSVINGAGYGGCHKPIRLAALNTSSTNVAPVDISTNGNHRIVKDGGMTEIQIDTLCCDEQRDLSLLSSEASVSRRASLTKSSVTGVSKLLTPPRLGLNEDALSSISDTNSFESSLNSSLPVSHADQQYNQTGSSLLVKQSIVTTTAATTAVSLASNSSALDHNKHQHSFIERLTSIMDDKLSAGLSLVESTGGSTDTGKRVSVVVCENSSGVAISATSESVNESVKKQVEGMIVDCSNGDDNHRMAGKDTKVVFCNITSGQAVPQQQQRTMYDEEITYVGYFSSDEIDMLQFLQDKAASLQVHIERIVKLAETNYERDYMWNKLMMASNASIKQRHQLLPASSIVANFKSTYNSSSSSSCDTECPLSLNEVGKLLAATQVISLTSLDEKLEALLSVHVDCFLHMMKLFADAKHASAHSLTHRFYLLDASFENSILARQHAHLPLLQLLYIDLNCLESFILVTIDENQAVKLEMVFKDEQPTAYTPNNNTSGDNFDLASRVELSQKSQGLLNHFVNSCATFVWSTLFSCSS